MDRAELLEWLQEANRRWEQLLDEIGPARMEQTGVSGDWSFKDLIAHLTGWNRRLVDRFGAAGRGEPEPPPPWPAHLEEEDDINAWIYQTNRERSLGEVLDESRRVFQELLAAVAVLPDDVRIEPSWRLVSLGDERFHTSEFFDHFRDDHEPDVRAWLARLEGQ